MARHRSIRNAKSFDYDDDYDVFGQSYEEDYGVSPGTMAQYSYFRSDRDLNSYMPTEAPLNEVPDENAEIAQQQKSPGSLATSIEYVCDIVGETYPQETIRDAIIKFNCDIERVVDYLLNNEVAQTSKKYNTSDEWSQSGGYANNGGSATSKFQNKEQYGRQSHNKKTSNEVECQKIQNITISKPKTGPTVSKVATNSRTPVKTGFKTPSSTIITLNSKEPTKKSPSTSRKNNQLVVDGRTKQNPSKQRDSSPAATLPSTPKRPPNADIAGSSTPSGKNSKTNVNFQEELQKRVSDSKIQLSMVVIGHVDAGKSTMMGHLLYQKGVVSQRLIHKYEQESRKAGKASFAYAWVLDETGEERTRGVTMDIAHNRFETDKHLVNLMDAPGHRDFIPNMITGASQADVAILVVGSSTGEFEAGFGVGGQTREHALLVRSLGVSQLAVAVNKLDTVDWSKKRFDDIVSKLQHFLKQAGYKDADVSFVPVSGLLGENLTKPASAANLVSWYKGPSLLQVIDSFNPPNRPVNFAFRFCINDVFRGQGSGISLSGKIESGGICPNTKVLVMPAGERGVVKSIERDDMKVDVALAGDHTVLSLNGVDIMKVTIGSVLCDVTQPILAVTRLQARIVVFNIEVPITRGFPVELHYKAVSEPAIVRRIISQLHKSSGEIIAKKPKMILKGQNALVEVETTRAVCLEEYAVLKELGRFTLRYGGSTIAACVVTKLLS